MIRATARSAATSDRLWSIASDVERWGDRLSTVDVVRPLSSGPTVVGSKFEVRQPGLPKAVWEVTDWQQGRSFTWVSTSLGIRSTAVHTVHNDGGGARLDLLLEWSGPLARVLELLIGRKGQGHDRDRGPNLHATRRANVTWTSPLHGCVHRQGRPHGRKDLTAKQVTRAIRGGPVATRRRLPDCPAETHPSFPAFG